MDEVSLPYPEGLGFASRPRSHGTPAAASGLQADDEDSLVAQDRVLVESELRKYVEDGILGSVENGCHLYSY